MEPQMDYSTCPCGNLYIYCVNSSDFWQKFGWQLANQLFHLFFLSFYFHCHNCSMEDIQHFDGFWKLLFKPLFQIQHWLSNVWTETAVKMILSCLASITAGLFDLWMNAVHTYVFRTTRPILVRLLEKIENNIKRTLAFAKTFSISLLNITVGDTLLR